MTPEGVKPEWVDKALNTRLPSGGLPTLNEPQMRAILAAVLPEAMAEAWDEGKGALAAAWHPDAAPLINPYREGAKGGGEG
jgi:hypothetical protein